MRLYLVVNRYSMSVQAGIQGMHVIPELYEKFKKPKWDPAFAENLSDWACNHKTIMLLRTFGGDESVEELYEKIAPSAKGLQMPFALFREGAMRNCATAVGVVVPTAYYSHPIEELSGDLLTLRETLSPFPFAI